MAVLTVQTTNRAGIDISVAAMAACAGGGDSFPNSGAELVIFNNTDAGQVTVTLTFAPGATVDGAVPAAKTVVVPATTGRKIVGPFPTAVYNDANSNMNFTYSGVVALKVAVIKPATS